MTEPTPDTEPACTSNPRVALSLIETAIAGSSPADGKEYLAGLYMKKGELLMELFKDDPDSTHVGMAVQSLERARQLLSRRQHPEAYAEAMFHYGHALLVSADLSASADVGKKALQALSEAASYYTGPKDRMNEAIIAWNAGMAHHLIYAVTGSVPQLAKAQKKFEQAVSILETETEAHTQMPRILFSLASIQDEMAEHTAPVRNRKAAIATYRRALETYEEGSEEWAHTQVRLGASLFELAVKEWDAAYADEIYAAYDKAVQVLTRAAYPERYAEAMHFKAIAATVAAALRKEQRDRDILRSAYNETFSVYTPQTHPREYAESRLAVGRSYRDEDPDSPRCQEQALEAYESVVALKTSEEVLGPQSLAAREIGTLAVKLGGKRKDFIARAHEALDTMLMQKGSLPSEEVDAMLTLMEQLNTLS